MDITMIGVIQIATQSNITSVGILDSLTVSGVSTMTNIYASSVSTFLNLYSYGSFKVTNNSTCLITHTGSSSEVIPLSISTPNLLSGQSKTLRLGVNTTSNYNMGQISFAYNSSGSNQNRLDFGFNGIGPELSIRGDGNVGIGTTNPSQLLDVNGGNIRCSGYIKPEAWVSGQIIQVANFNPETTVPSQYVFNSTTYMTWVSVSFTPKSNSSTIVVEADASYEIGGSSVDNFKINVLDNGVQKYEKTQVFINVNGGGTRSGVLFPLSCSYQNTNLSTRTIAIQLARISANDSITISSSTNANWYLLITEMAV